MSYKTDRLTELFPDAYSAKETESLLYKLLDAIGAQLMGADDAVKRLLKSHWVDYASGPALDGLGAVYGVDRRLLRDGTLETDNAFRVRLKSVVPLFTGGGTVKAIKGAVRSALGLPFDLDSLNLPPALRNDLEGLIIIEEFSPAAERVVFDTVNTVDDASELMLVIDIPTVREERPRISWTFSTGGARMLSLERMDTGEGLRSDETLVIPPGKTLVLTADDFGRLSALVDLADVTSLFTNLDGSSPTLPEVPSGHSDWKFRAQSAVFDTGTFDESDTYDLPLFRVEMSWTRYEPLTFDLFVPYFIQSAVAELVRRHNFTGELFVFQGLPFEVMQDVVDQTRAAGVRGNVHFSLNFYEDHNQRERSFSILGLQHASEDASASESLVVGSLNRLSESHGVIEAFALGGSFDSSTFDNDYGFE